MRSRTRSLCEQRGLTQDFLGQVGFAAVGRKNGSVRTRVSDDLEATRTLSPPGFGLAGCCGGHDLRLEGRASEAAGRVFAASVNGFGAR